VTQERSAAGYGCAVFLAVLALRLAHIRGSPGLI
jgi:hypothetical protein